MLAAILLSFREGLEAALIIGIVLGYLRKAGHLDHQKIVWGGVAVAAAASLLTALGLSLVGASFEGQAEKLFEGSTMLLAAGVLTWMIFWMQTQSRYLRQELEHGVHRALATGRDWGLFSLAFIAVFREGLETALFLTAAMFTSSLWQTTISALVGLVAAVVAGWLIFATTVRLDARSFFRVTSFILIFFAAGLVAHGVHELQEAGLLPVIIEHVWDTSAILDDESALGRVLKSLFGYNSDPSLLEVLGYIGYYATIGLVTWRRQTRVLPPEASVRLLTMDEEPTRYHSESEAARTES